MGDLGSVLPVCAITHVERRKRKEEVTTRDSRKILWKEVERFGKI